MLLKGARAKEVSEGEELHLSPGMESRREGWWWAWSIEGLRRQHVVSAVCLGQVLAWAGIRQLVSPTYVCVPAEVRAEVATFNGSSTWTYSLIWLWICFVMQFGHLTDESSFFWGRFQTQLRSIGKAFIICCYSLLDELSLMWWVLCRTRAADDIHLGCIKGLYYIDESVVDFPPACQTSDCRAESYVSVPSHLTLIILNGFRRVTQTWTKCIIVSVSAKQRQPEEGCGLCEWQVWVINSPLQSNTARSGSTWRGRSAPPRGRLQARCWHQRCPRITGSRPLDPSHHPLLQTPH